MNRRLPALVVAALVLFAGASWAQTAARIRADVVSFDGGTLVVRTAAGREVRVRVTDATRIAYPRALRLADIKEGDFVGSAAMPGPDGKLLAREVHVFSAAQRGTGEGHRPFDLAPGSTMTNGAIAMSVAGVRGRELTLRYKEGEKLVIVPEGTPIVANEPGDKSLLVPGAYVIVSGQTAPDGSVAAQSIQATSRDGVKPPT
jgi:hypothetical protein